MSWFLLLFPGLVLAVAAAAVARRGYQRIRFARTRREIADARSRGSHTARLQHPFIDLKNCIGGTASGEQRFLGAVTSGR